MKRYLLLLIAAINVVIAYADFVHLDLSEKNIPTEDVISYFAEWFHTGNSTFEIFNERYDHIGYKHLNYQQYVDGIKVEDCALYVHSKRGYVTYINGDIMPIANNPKSEVKISTISAKKKVGAESQEEPEIVLIYKQLQDTSIFYKTYKVITDTAQVYVDVETGEIINTISTIYYATKNCSMPTMYSGVKRVDCMYDNNLYFLHNDKVTMAAMDLNTSNLDINTAVPYINTSSNWSNSYLTSITISACRNNWWGVLGLEAPDLYIEILDKNNNRIYITDYKSDVKEAFITFRFSEAILVPDDGEIKINIWDKDIAGDQLGTTLSLTSNALGEYTWGDDFSNTSGSLIITNAVPAYDAFWGANATYDFYKTIFNLDGFDGNGTQVKILLHSPTTPNIENQGYKYYLGAYSSHTPNQPNSSYMSFGMGNENGNPCVGLNTLTHEYTHLVTGFRPNKGLVNQGESGAINEGYSDVMAEVAEYYITGSNDWLFDTESDVNGFLFMRDISNPRNPGYEGEKPTTYKGNDWVNTSDVSKENDYGGVHANNSIFTYWFYLLSEGGKGTNDNNDSYDVKGVGIEEAAKIAWRMHREYLPEKCTFKEARELSIQSVRDLSNGVIGTPMEIAVVNAWHAVGVGDKYVEEPQDSNLKPGKYVIVANREEDSKNNWYYMTSDLGTASTKRFQAVSASTENIDAIATSNLDAQYIWELEADGSNWKLKNGDQYATWKSGNSANLDATGKSFTFDITDNQVVVHFNDGSTERYLSLHTGNDYFAFYGNTGQIEQLYFLPYEDKTTPPTPEREYKSVPYTETFASSQGDFTVYNALLPSGFTSIWNWDSRYGMVAKCIKGSTKYASEAYLISPWIELPENSQCVLTFSHAAKFFQDTKQMSLWISTNYVETNPESADWDRLIIPTYPTGDNWNWFESGAIDLSSYSGKNVNIAFCYTSTESYAPQWEIKNFAVKQATTTVLENIDVEKSTSTKLLRNGQLLIIRDGKTYNAMGQEL